MGSKKNEEKQEERQAVVAADTEVQTVPAAAEREQLIYIGPPLREGGVGIRTNQTFLGGHPAYFKPLYTAYPQIKELFVPVDKLQEAQKQIKKTGTALNAALLSLKGV
ncbi:hypothetical protein FHS19_006847 [Paenibacillus rhizosphaerae]|uniref:Uncharacterized protein n=1 Tax=Paenibacillus rhizosphaerae TaxID=297318 RepID=A0A839U309_9BACL|nr:hypothetical protein [Paenibacillus rhizosphaerae]MBB3132120.1 hypothetical protein [Paenibacillus rhizosphaerae]